MSAQRGRERPCAAVLIGPLAGALLLAVLGVGQAEAQDTDMQFDESESSNPGVSDSAASDAPTLEGDTQDATAAPEAPTDGGEGSSGWTLPRVLVLLDARVPARLGRRVGELIGQAGEVVPDDAMVREARARGLPVDTPEALAELLPAQEVALVVSVALGARSGDPRRRGGQWLAVAYLEGRSGAILLDELHPVAGDRLLDDVEQRILSELRLALAVVTRPAAGAGAAATEGDAEGPPLPEPGDPVGEDTQPGAAVRFDLHAGVGFGTRSFDLPTAAGIVRLSTSAFPAANLGLRAAIEPTAQAQLGWGFGLAYRTSVGLEATDRRLDGTTRDTTSRSQSLLVSAGPSYRVSADPGSVTIGAEVGYAMRSFGSEAPVTLPDYALAGPTLSGRLLVPLFAGAAVITVAPEVQWIVAVEDTLVAHGVPNTALSIGGEVQLRVALSEIISLRASYREAHALLGSEAGESADVERYVTLDASYRP